MVLLIKSEVIAHNEIAEIYQTELRAIVQEKKERKNYSQHKASANNIIINNKDPYAAFREVPEFL